MEQLWEDLDNGEFHIRDKWQVELKSDFFPHPALASSEYVQEFYLFIPNSLQINSLTYTKNQFYHDQTNLIRYKTPEFTFRDILNVNNPRSPLTRILHLCEMPETSENQTAISDELKLLGNVVRSALREQVKNLIAELVIERNEERSVGFSEHTMQLCMDIQQLRKAYSQAQSLFLNEWGNSAFFRNFLYIDEFISAAITHYLTGLLENIRLSVNKHLVSVDSAICEVLINEKRITEAYVGSPAGISDPVDEREREQILYRKGLLNKFVLDALLLHTSRFTLEQRYQHWIGGIAAGVAMTIFFVLFVWLGRVFVINSQPFILFTVIIYILKDRIKEWIKTLSYHHAFKWFSDFSTEIQPPDESYKLGVIKETFSFIDENQLSPDIRNARNKEFHEVLETFQRPEEVLFYKRTVEITNLQGREGRRHGLNIIFRFNIHRFLRKASNPVEMYYTLDSKTKKLLSMRLPKVYHLDMIIKNFGSSHTGQATTELKKLRIVIDKNGIKRIEQLPRFQL